MEPVYKVRALEKLYYIDDLKIPGEKRRNGDPADEFCLVKKEDFNPNLMVAIGWDPKSVLKQMPKEDSLLYKEDGSKRTQVEMANIKSDKLDDSLRKARATKTAKEEKDFREGIEKPKEVL